MTLSRGAALLILLGLVVALWFGPIAVYADLVGAGGERIVNAEKKLARFRTLVREPAETGAAVDPKAVFLPEHSDAEAVALLQETLKSAAATAQVEIQGVQVLQAETLPGASRIVVRVRGRGDMPGLDRLLYAIEASRPLLHPDNLQLQSHALPQAAAPAALDFQLDVSGFRAGPPA